MPPSEARASEDAALGGAALNRSERVFGGGGGSSKPEQMKKKTFLEVFFSFSFFCLFFFLLPSTVFPCPGFSYLLQTKIKDKERGFESWLSPSSRIQFAFNPTATESLSFFSLCFFFHLTKKTLAQKI